MVSRVPAKHLFRHILRFGTGAVLALSLFCTGFSSSTALAARIYELHDGSEGDPGDGVLSPRAAGNNTDKSTVSLDEKVIPGDYGYLLVPVFTNWASPGTASLRFLLIPRSGPGDGIVIGTASWPSTFSGRWWNHAR